MSGDDAYLTLRGNLTAAPTLRYLDTGTAVASFTIASAARHFDRQAGVWAEQEPLYVTCTAWRATAEHLAESSLTGGQRILVYGKVKQRSYQTAAGLKRTVLELEVDDIGASLRHASVTVRRATRAAPNSGGGAWAGTGPATAPS